MECWSKVPHGCSFSNHGLHLAKTTCRARHSVTLAAAVNARPQQLILAAQQTWAQLVAAHENLKHLALNCTKPLLQEQVRRSQLFSEE